MKSQSYAQTSEPLNISRLIDDYLASPEFRKLQQFYPNVTVQAGLDKDLFNINGSAVHIGKIIMNLVSNASEAIEGMGNVNISTSNQYVEVPIEG